MAALDAEKILRFEAEIIEARKVLGDITSGEVHEFLRDPIKVRAMKYTLIVLVEAICNLCRHILAKKAYLVIEEYMEAILKMQEKGMIPENLMNQLIPLTKLRHQLIHGYWKTDDRRLFIETKQNLEAIDSFLAEIHRLK
jgi:uncharacterized protein YutE (UPF0331/DUF86 family)